MDLHVWARPTLGHERRNLPTLARLCAAERAYLQTIGDDQAANHFVASHALLRDLLAIQYPESVRKLVLARRQSSHWQIVAPDDMRAVAFSLSHAGGAVAAATAADGAIGVDLEPVASARHEGMPFEATIASALSSREKSRLGALPAAKRAAAALEVWTVKEACVKAFGLGHSYDVAALTVLPTEPLTIDGPMPAGFSANAMFIESRELIIDAERYQIALAFHHESDSHTIPPNIQLHVEHSHSGS